MKIAKKYSHLNGEEYLIVHHKSLYQEIKEVISSINAEKFKTKISKEKRNKGTVLYSPAILNKEFVEKFRYKDWHEGRYSYYITLDRTLMEKSTLLSVDEQKKIPD